uniref:Neuropeptide ETH n=1 Tax=Diaphorina citri TaxID=121845 RepID=A0A2U9PFR3_DIACI|nr:neuropeptide ETH [Diaphorina citri]
MSRMWVLVFLSAATLYITAAHNNLGWYDNYLPRIGRRDPSVPSGFIWKSTIPSPAYERPARGYAGDEYFLKAAKSVPRIGRRDDNGFLKAGKSIPRIGRRNEEFVREDPQEDKRTLGAEDDLMYYGGLGYGNDEHYVFKRKLNGPSNHQNMY